MNAALGAHGARDTHANADAVPAVVDLTGWVIPDQFLVECRGLTAALMHEQPARPPCIVSLTAVRPRVGVTTLAWCLARYLAQGTGQSVLLVDAGVPGAASGRPAPALGDLPSGAATGAEAARPTTDAGLSYLEAGAMVGRMPGDRLEALIAQLRTRYAYVILDLPPVMAPTFNEAVVQISDVAMLVVEPDVDTIEVVQKSVAILQQMTKLLGVVFNRAGGA